MEVRVTFNDSCGSCVQYKDVKVTYVSDTNFIIVLSSETDSDAFYDECHPIKLSTIKSIKIIP